MVKKKRIYVVIYTIIFILFALWISLEKNTTQYNFANTLDIKYIFFYNIFECLFLIAIIFTTLLATSLIFIKKKINKITNIIKIIILFITSVSISLIIPSTINIRYTFNNEELTTIEILINQYKDIKNNETETIKLNQLYTKKKSFTPFITLYYISDEDETYKVPVIPQLCSNISNILDIKDENMSITYYKNSGILKSINEIDINTSDLSEYKNNQNDIYIKMNWDIDSNIITYEYNDITQNYIYNSYICLVTFDDNNLILWEDVVGYGDNHAEIMLDDGNYSFAVCKAKNGKYEKISENTIHYTIKDNKIIEYYEITNTKK